MFRRAVVDALIGDSEAKLSAEGKQDVREFVERQFKAMPAHLRFGVAVAEACAVIGARARGWVRSHAQSSEKISDLIHRWESKGLPPVRMYVRLVRSLVLFSAHELSSSER